MNIVDLKTKHMIDKEYNLLTNYNKFSIEWLNYLYNHKNVLKIYFMLDIKI